MTFQQQWLPYYEFEATEENPKQEKKIWYLWGGQLAQLWSIAAQKQGFDTVVFTAEWKNCPAAQVSPFVQIAYDDTKNSVQSVLDSWVDVVTAEWENVPAKLAKAISEAGIDMYPNWKVYELVQDRETEKNAVIDCFDGDKNIVVDFAWSVTSEDDLRKAYEGIWSGILKTASGWYDGKWQVMIENEEELEAYISWVREEQKALKEFIEGLWDITKEEEESKIKAFKKKRKFVDFDEVKCIYEEKLEDFYELSVMVARSSNGDVVAFDPAYNKHENWVLAESIIPAWEAWDSRVSPEIIEKAKQVAIQLTERYWCEEWIIGLVWVELFILPDGSIKVNEIAPRAHNSWHHTEYSHDISQFEMLHLAITGQNLPEPELTSKVHLTNMLTDEVLKIKGRLKSKSYGRYEQDNWNGTSIITVDYWKWFGANDNEEIAIDANWDMVVRKRGHIMETSKLNEKFLKQFGKKVA